MLLAARLFLVFGVTSSSAVLLTASDLRKCSVECFCLMGEKVSIPVTDYERQCRSVPFQIHLRKRSKNACTEEEFDFVCSLKIGVDYRLTFRQMNIVLNSE